MTLKEFKDLISDLEKKGKINDDSEVFVLNDDQDVMSEPELLISDMDLILNFSYRNEVLIESDNVNR
ncbi:hypothetical protein [Succinivibrio sp.]|uniref:hypothetical protein n=1 Tax=Succinivibrio sp. TaxID=2053619 RepID=UPI003864596A